MKKHIKFLILTAVCLLFTAYVFAQSGFQRPTGLEMNGLFIGGTYQKAQVAEILGTPDKYWSGTSEFGLDEEYKYGENILRFSDSGIFGTFVLYDNRFYILDNQVRVGDPVSKLNDIPNGELVLKPDGKYYFWLGRMDDAIEIRHKNNIITALLFSASI